MIGVKSAYVHNEDTSFVEFLDRPLGWHTNGADEQFGLLLDDDIDELGQLTLGIVILEQY